MNGLRRIRILIVALLMSVAQAALAGSDGCPRCSSKTCVPIAVDKETKKHCYKVECKQICIPATRFPWQKCCKPKCGRVINVRVLKKVDYKCKSCGYKWDIKGGKDCGAGGKISRSPQQQTPRPAVRAPYRMVSGPSSRDSRTAPGTRSAAPATRTLFDYFKK